MKSRSDHIKYKIILFIVNCLRLFISKTDNKIIDNFFILGSGRNGSTLLASILNAHKDLFVPPEQFVLPYAIMRRYLSCFKTTNTWKNDVVKMLSEKKKTLNWNVNLNDIKIEYKNVSSLFNKIYLRYANQNKGQITMWGDKTPINTHFINFIFPEFKSSKYIFLIRDVRDVTLSYKKLKGHKAANTRYAIWKWKDSIDKLRYLQKRTNVLIIKYEDFVSKPQEEINRVLNYLGLPKDNTLINSKIEASDMGVGDKFHHQNLSQPISSKSVGKWKEYLSDYDINLVNKECSDYLKEFGYSI